MRSAAQGSAPPDGIAFDVSFPPRKMGDDSAWSKDQVIAPDGYRCPNCLPEGYVSASRRIPAIPRESDDAQHHADDCDLHAVRYLMHAVASDIPTNDHTTVPTLFCYVARSVSRREVKTTDAAEQAVMKE